MDAKTETVPPVVHARRAPKAIYALAQYSIEQRGSHWYYVRTIDHLQFPNGHRSGPWHGPYRSLHAVTIAIASAIEKEARARHRKRCERYGVPE